MDFEYIRHRITDLRIKKGVSEYQMSLDLGHSRSYIQNITNGRSKPSIDEFLYICKYLEITPKDFFDDGNGEPILIQRALDGMRTLSSADLDALIAIIDRLKAK